MQVAFLWTYTRYEYTVWDEAKRLKNLRDHDLDFRKVHSVFEGRTATLEDNRFDYDVA